jgi:hypothetical protein
VIAPPFVGRDKELPFVGRDEELEFLDRLTTASLPSITSLTGLAESANHAFSMPSRGDGGLPARPSCASAAGSSNRRRPRRVPVGARK